MTLPPLGCVTPGWLRKRGAIERLVRAVMQDQLVAGARILDVTPEEYLADPCSSPSLNATTAHAIVGESPLHAWSQHPRLGGAAHGGNGTKAMQDGTLLHRLLLDKGKEIAVIDAPDFRTNAARDARDAAIDCGKMPVLQHQFAQKAAVAAKLRDQLEARGYVFDGQSELAIEWRDGDVLCRSMLDHARVKDGAIFEIKKVESANPKKIARTFVDYGYDIQYTAHTRALAKLRPEFEGRIDFTFLFLEIEPPYSVVPVKPDGALREIGALRWEQALRTWRECLAANRWPGYADGEPVVLEAPQWVVTEQLGTWQ